MKLSLVKVLLAISLSLMVMLAITGVYVVASQSREESIIIPPSAGKTLPSQAPRRRPTSPYLIQPQNVVPDSPRPQ